MASLTALRTLSLVHALPLSEAALAAVASLPRLQAFSLTRHGTHPAGTDDSAGGDGRHILALTACTALTSLCWHQSQVTSLWQFCATGEYIDRFTNAQVLSSKIRSKNPSLQYIMRCHIHDN